MLCTQMKLARQGECGSDNSLFPVEVPLWYESRGKVSSQWLSVCTKERQQTKDLMERIAHPKNLQEACKQVAQNGGISGIDKMSVSEWKVWFNQNVTNLSEELMNGKYPPKSTREVLIPKPQGGTRQSRHSYRHR